MLLSMARTLSEEKREAILEAAAELVATLGTGAPTARIAKAAGFAEGTLFTYFATKDDLLNQLFLEIEAELAKTLLDAYPSQGNARERTQYLWDRLIDWGAAHPMKRKAMRQLKVSDRITEDSRSRAAVLFRDLNSLLEQDLSGHVANDYASTYISAILDTLAEATLEFIAREPGKRAHYKRAGFEIFWKGIAA